MDTQAVEEGSPTAFHLKFSLFKQGLRATPNDADATVDSLKKRTLELEKRLSESYVDIDRLSLDLCKLRNSLLEDDNKQSIGKFRCMGGISRCAIFRFRHIPRQAKIMLKPYQIRSGRKLKYALAAVNQPYPVQRCFGHSSHQKSKCVNICDSDVNNTGNKLLRGLVQLSVVHNPLRTATAKLYCLPKSICQTIGDRRSGEFPTHPEKYERYCRRERTEMAWKCDVLGEHETEVYSVANEKNYRNKRRIKPNLQSEPEQSVNEGLLADQFKCKDSTSLFWTQNYGSSSQLLIAYEVDVSLDRNSRDRFRVLSARKRLTGKEHKRTSQCESVDLIYKPIINRIQNCWHAHEIMGFVFLLRRLRLHERLFIFTIPFCYGLNAYPDGSLQVVECPPVSTHLPYTAFPSLIST
ncbi:hypothetical protein CLF_108740 [Clonorchis sinensis]|uniref:Uncharacterized protein n=1 Tax=Clonorchis sinensis TaxID=79923 RepID=G7YIG2_CLOSI|nr:hypothetical protein CLF_108740 [Clonorchis sinensis]